MPLCLKRKCVCAKAAQSNLALDSKVEGAIGSLMCWQGGSSLWLIEQQGRAPALERCLYMQLCCLPTTYRDLLWRWEDISPSALELVAHAIT